MNKPQILTKSISSLVLFAALSGSAHAASATWLGTADNLWSNGANWSTTPVPGTGDIATFNGPGNLNTTISLGAGVTVNSILFDTPAAAGYTIGSGAVGSQILTLDNAGGVTVNNTVTNNELFNANLVLGNDGSLQTFNIVNNSVAAGQTLTFAGGITGSNGVAVKTLAVAGAGNTVVSGVIGNGATGAVAVTKAGTGTLTLSGANTYTGGTTLNTGTLNINNASALGNNTTGGLVINGGTLNNSSGGAITTTAAKTMSWNGDFTFTGTNNLSTNLGAVTIGGGAGQRTVTVSNGVLSTGLWNSGAGIGLTKAGPGTLFMASTDNASNIGGSLNIQQGTVQIAGDLTMGGLTGSGTLENGGPGSKWFFVNNASDNTFSGTIRNNPQGTTGAVTVGLGLVKRGIGTLNLTGANNAFDDRFAIEQGTVRMTGVNITGGRGNGNVDIGNVANQFGVLLLEGGTLNANRGGAPSVNMGTVGNSAGYIKKTNGGNLTSASEMWVGGAVNGFGAFSTDSGTTTVGNWFAVGRDGIGVFNMSGGTMSVTAANYTMGSFVNGFGVTNISGGTINVTSTTGDQGTLLVAEAGGAILNVSNDAAVNISGTRGLLIANNGGTGIVNLNGGSITTRQVLKGSSTGFLNFNGGTLRANANNANFINNLTNIYVYGGGATIDTNGNAISINQALLAADGNGLSSIAVANGGAGYVDTPVVRISGGTGQGATAIANLSGGVITGFTITNPGIGYTPGDVLTITLTGGNPTAVATPGTASFAPNVSGGLTKVGANTLTLLGASTYTGPTTILNGKILVGTSEVLGVGNLIVNGPSAALDLDFNTETVGTVTLDGGGSITANGGFLTSTSGFELKNGSASAPLDGTVGLNKTTAGNVTLSGASTYTGATSVSGGSLIISGAGTINTTSSITIDGPGARLVQSSSENLTVPVTVTNGTLDGTTTVTSATVGNGTGGIIANGNGTAGTLTIGTLSFSGEATANLTVNVPATPAVTITGALTLNAAGKVTINAVNSNSIWTNGQTYHLFNYGSLGGAGFSGFQKGTITGLGARQSATLTNSAGFIGLAIAGDMPIWTGSQGNSWTTLVLPNPKNWKLQTAGTNTDFISGDAVLFDESATGTTSINIANSNVNITSARFNNSSKTYTISSAGGFGITGGFVIKTGNGTVTINTNNTYSGGTTVSAGTFILNGNNNFGAGGITLNGGTLTIAGTNVYTGPTAVNAGTINLNSAGALGTSTLSLNTSTIANTSGAAVTISGGSVLLVDDAIVTFAGTNNLNLGNGLVTVGTTAADGNYTIVNNTASTLTFGGDVTTGSGGTAGTKTVNVTGSGSTNFSGNINAGNSLGMVVNVTGTGNNTFSGNFSVGTGLGIVVNDTSTGKLTLSGASSTITTVNLNGGSTDILEVGAGNLTVAGNTALQSLTGGIINASGGGSIRVGSNGGDFGTAAGTTLTVNAKISGTNTIDFFNADTATVGLGTIVLTAANDYTGGTNIENVRVVIPSTGNINAGNVANAGQINVGNTAASAAVLKLDNVNLNATKAAAPSLVVGNGGAAAGALIQNGGVLTSISELWVGGASGGYGSYALNGGTLNVGNWMAVGRNGNGVLNLESGTINVTNQNFVLASFGGSSGEVNLRGGTVNVTSTATDQGRFMVGEGGSGTLNMSGDAALNISGARGLELAVGNPAGSGPGGIVNLNGGTITTPIVQKGTASSATLNFHGGVLKASANNVSFLGNQATPANSLTNAYVYDGDAIIDDGGFSITVSQPLLAPTGKGIASIDLVGGTGYVAAPLVQIFGGSGTGATAVASIDGDGNLIGITITNPGVDYTEDNPPLVTLVGGGSIDGQIDVVSFSDNSSGGFRKRGSGTLTLAGANTYTGQTVVETGTLALTGSISASTAIDVRAGATLDVNGLGGAFALVTGQTLKGNGTVLGTTTIGAGAKLSPGASAGTLTTSSLTLDSASTSEFELAAGNITPGGGINDLVVVNGDLTLDGTLMITDLGGLLTNGLYTLFDYNGTLTNNELTIDPGYLLTHPNAAIVIDTIDTRVLISIPEPGVIVSLAGGVALLLGLRRRRA